MSSVFISIHCNLFQRRLLRLISRLYCIKKVLTIFLSVKLPDARIEAYTRIEYTKNHGSEIKYSPYENLPPFSYLPIVIHFESNRPFAIAKELVREIEISHWSNVQVTEHYNPVHGPQSKGEFFRLDYQARPYVRGAVAFRRLIAKLPPRA